MSVPLAAQFYMCYHCRSCGIIVAIFLAMTGPSSLGKRISNCLLATWGLVFFHSSALLMMHVLNPSKG
ncbi:hypothetical protein BKA56DRAFT_571711 [Ilyonectria sp. MPI-CAGE-AT-0026]|nr:hypothetical protein BKA56DRAFT_571711 [Ilyonectria sp. MPI-CAGE-AT-0026]